MTDDLMHTRIEKATAANKKLAERLNRRWYPRFHIAAPAGWINDPNGLIHFQGRYHVFFQHHPYSDEWGPMHWGHVSSPDLVTWERHPIALAPSIEEDKDGVFSGSAIVGPDGKLNVFYTGHRWRNGKDGTDGNLQVQCRAISEDGIHFEKVGVVVEGPSELLDFRDPKVWKQGDRWYMVFGAQSADHRGEVWMYVSRDLENWEFDRVVFQDPNPDAYMLECPDLFPLGDHWVLVYCPMGPAKDGYRNRNGHNAGDVVGDWAPGQDFTPLTEYRPLDWGANFYAPQTFAAPDGRRLMFGWMGAFDDPVASQGTDNWAGQLTVPREVSLLDDLQVALRPAAELSQGLPNEKDFGTFTITGAKTLAEDLTCADIELTIDYAASTAERVGLQLADTFVYYDDLAHRMGIDRRQAPVEPRSYRAAPVEPGDELTLRVLVDVGSVEVFAGDTCVSSLTAASDGPRAVTLTAEGGDAVVTACRVRTLD